ncbi:MAG: hypothetical protein R2716_11105 [Microthrixaceae bacterium]
MGRVGVDEFLVLVTTGELAGTRLEDLRDGRLDQACGGRAPCRDGLELHLTASVGAAQAPEDATGATELLSAADRAVRSDGRPDATSSASTTSRSTSRNHERLVLDSELRRATARQELEVYQPIVEVCSGRPRRGGGAGALAPRPAGPGASR